MAQFKVGDRVRYKYDRDEGPVLKVTDEVVYVDWVKDGLVDVHFEDIELVEEQPNRTYYAGTKPDFLETVSKFAASTQVSPEDVRAVHSLGEQLGVATPVDPDHYKFPGGVEVIHISQWLTANAAQALQYIARSSRIDGKNKGDASEDIRKAITFLEFELKRLEGK